MSPPPEGVAAGAPRGLEPAPAVAGTVGYCVPRAETPLDLYLDGNEGLAPPAAWLADALNYDAETLRRYPDATALGDTLARLHGVGPDQVLVTAGADDAIDRACRAVLAPGRQLLLPVPSFEMFERFARWAGADVVTVPWTEPEFPRAALLAHVGPQTAAIAFVSPNNPTGSVVHAADLRALGAAAPHALLLVDHAYVEFADPAHDLTAEALRLPNAVVFRTFSKAWGLAGLRVGYALAAPAVISWLRAAGLPYAASGLSLALVQARLAHSSAPDPAFLDAVRAERAALTALCASHGGVPLPSAANFVLMRHPAAAWLHAALGGLGIAVRRFVGRPLLADHLRISCPGAAPAFARLTAGVRAALAPQALLFDMDGVLADVSQSYRQAIVATAAEYGVVLTPDEVARAKAEGQASNDWVLTARLLARQGIDAPLGEVTARFERLYQGSDSRPGLRASERLIPARADLQALAARLPLGIVTGRPRADAERFLAAHRLRGLFGAVVCMEDGPGKPDPAPVRRALSALGAESAWMIGDMPDDVRAARAAGVVPLGVLAPGDAAAELAPPLRRAGAARVLEKFSELRDLLWEVLP